MNFEGKHLVRWGIPGWTYLIIIISYFLIVDNKVLFYFFLEGEASIVGLTALVAGVGIIIGHLMHQISMVFGFLIWNNWNTYFDKEYEFDRIMLVHPEGQKVQKIYSHRLGQLHALRALTTSGILSTITLIFLLSKYCCTKSSIFLLVGVLSLTILVYINYFYFHKNLEYYTRKIKSENTKED